MALETGTFISDLVASNPVGATDPKSEGDDHIRLIKSVILATFPNIDGEVTATEDDLNILATDTANAGMVADIAALADPGADRIFGWDDSAGAAIGFSLGTGLEFSGTSLQTNSNVPLLDAANVFTGGSFSPAGSQAISLVSSSPYISAHHTGANEDEGTWQFGATSGGEFRFYTVADAGTPQASDIGVRFVRDGLTWDSIELDANTIELNGVDVSDYARLSQNNEFTQSGGLSGSSALFVNANQPTLFFDSGAAGTDEGKSRFTAVGSQLRFSLLNDAEDTLVDWLTVDRSDEDPTTINFPNGELQYDGDEVGFRAVVSTGDKPGNYTFTASDSGKHAEYTGSGGDTFTIPSNASVPYEHGTVLTMINDGSGNLTIALDSDTLILAGAGSTGSRTLAPNGLATAIKIGSTRWFISGTGLS